MTTVAFVTEPAASDQWADTVTPWLHEAANPYFDVVFGGNDVARRVIRDWTRRESSELSLKRLTVMLEGDTPVGMFIALSGEELSRCRKADSVAMRKEVRGKGGDELLDRLRSVSALRGSVEPDEFYLSKVAVAPSARGRGLGRVLVGEFLARGLRLGFGRFRLEVAEDNDAAVALYRSEGFVTIEKLESPATGMVFLSMAAERSV